MVGHSESSISFSGLNIAYVYPDKVTSIIGHFENDTLIRGELYELSGIINNEGKYPPTPIFKKVITSETQQKRHRNIFMYEPANQTSIGEHPLQRDPFEEKYLYISSSTIKGAGRGVFLKRNVTFGEVVGFYNGVRLTGMESKVKLEDRRSPYRMDNDWAVPDQIINMPPQYR